MYILHTGVKYELLSPSLIDTCLSDIGKVGLCDWTLLYECCSPCPRQLWWTTWLAAGHGGGEIPSSVDLLLRRAMVLALSFVSCPF